VVSAPTDPDATLVGSDPGALPTIAHAIVVCFTEGHFPVRM
jgi:hypothetical protein